MENDLFNLNNKIYSNYNITLNINEKKMLI